MERDLTVKQKKELLYAEYLFKKVWGRSAMYDEFHQLRDAVLQGKTFK